MSNASRNLGWTLASVSSAALLSGAAALALSVTPPPEPVMMALDLSVMPASAPHVAAMADPAPEVVQEIEDQPEPEPETEPPPELEADTAPDLPQQMPMMTLPEAETPVVADLSLPPPPPEPEPEPEPKPEPKVAKAEPKPEKKPEKKVEKKKEPVKAAEKPKEKAEDKPKKEKAKEKKSASAGATGAKESAKAKGGAEMSPAAFHKAVIKKINRTKKKRASDRGTVLVVFSIAKDGGLASVRVGQSSGSAELDQIAVDHIRRSAPFPAPPPGEGKNLSFKFTGK